MREVAARMEQYLQEWGVAYDAVEVHPERKIVQVFLPEGRLSEFPPAWVREGKVDLLRSVLGHYIPPEETGG